ncbi:MAG: hypothetical protein WBO08_06200 [Mycobacterium sp.]
MTGRQRRRLLARLRNRANDIAASEPLAESTPAVAPAMPLAPPRREHLFGSQYRVLMSFDELMATRGYLGEQALLQRQRVVPASDAQHRRDAATRRAGYLPDEVLWPSD